MIYDSIDLLRNTKISNMTVDSGSSFPSNPSTGEIFFKTDDAQLFMYQGTEWVQITGEIAASTPKIASVVITDSSYTGIDDTAVDTAGGYVQILGSGFTEGASVLIGQTVINAQNVTYISSSELRAVVPARLAGTYSMYVVNIDGSVGVRINAITYSPFPAWSTSSSLSTGEEVNIQLSASENATYALAAGSTLPEGITLSASGLLSGTIQNHVVGTVYNFSVVATDAENQDVTRAFSINIMVGDPYFKSNVLLINTNDTAFTVDASPNAFELAVNGDVKANKFNPFTPGYYSAYFDGTGDYLTMPTNAAFAMGSGDFTWEAFINFSSGSVYRQIISTRPNSSPGTPATSAGFMVNPSNGLTFYNNSFIINYTTPINLNQWIHVAVTRSGTSIRVFANGIQVGSTATNSQDFSNSILTIGANNDGSEAFNGFISNARIVKGTALYTSNFTPPTEPLTAVSGTSLLACQSARFIDNSPNNFSITRNGDTRVASSHPFTLPSEYSELGSAYFDGVGDSLTAAASSPTFISATGDWTIECWAYADTFSGPQYSCAIFNVGTNADNLTVRAVPTSASVTSINLYAINSSGAALWSAGVSAGTLLKNTWNHIAATRQSGIFRVFLNGQMIIQESTQTSTAIRTTTNDIHIGRAFAGSNPNWNGYISDFRVVNGTALYTSNFIPSTTPLTAVANTQLLTLQNNKPATNNEFLDESPNNFLITRFGNTTQASFSPFGEDWSVYFDGTGDFLTLPATFNTAMGGGLAGRISTIEAWINPVAWTNANSYTHGIYGTYQAVSANGRWLVQVIGGANTSGKLGFAYTITTGSQVDLRSTVTNIPLSEWSHIAIVIDAITPSSSTINFFVNGNLTDTFTNQNLTTHITNYSAPTIGGNHSQFCNGFIGYISNLRHIHGTALYTSNFAPPSEKLRAVPGTVLLTCQSNRFVDNASNFTITPSGDARVTRFSPFTLGTLDTAPTSYSAYFDGTGDFLTAPSSAAFAFGTGDFTVEFWVNSLNVLGSSQRGVIQISDVAGGFKTTYESGITIGFGAGGASLAPLNGGIWAQVGSNILSNSTTINTGVWYHVALVRSSNVSTLYVNGVSAGTHTGTTNLSGTNLVIGGYYSTAYLLEGNISNLRIVKGTALYTSSFTPAAAPLTAVSGTSLLTCQDSTFRDNSTNNFTLTANGNVVPSTVNPFGGISLTTTQEYSPSVFGGSMYFDGSGDYLQCLNSNTINIPASTPFTIEFWVYTTSTAANLAVVNRNWNYGGTGPTWAAYLSNGITPGFGIAGSGQSTYVLISSPVSGVRGQWNHYAFTRNSSNVIRVFVNGVQTNSRTDSQAMTSTTGNVFIGDSSNLAAPDFSGYISDLRVAIGTAVYTSSFIPPTQPVTAIPGTQLLVNGTNSALFDATSRNAIETVGNAKVSTKTAQWGTNTSLYFDGTGDYLKIYPDANFAFGTGDFTVEFWVNFSNAPNTSIYFIDARNSTQTTCWTLYRGADNVLSWATGSSFLPFGTLTTTNTWTHIAYTRSGTSGRMFVDGVLRGTSTDATNYSIVPVLSYIGIRFNLIEPVNGYMQDIRITKGTARYTASFALPEAKFGIK